ncbi:MAG: alpha-ribazole phosphatase [Anaerolineaceae bacterium]|nr:alpha-ribazole phosphatase [Anaerolineaceae bacterium]
MKTTMHLIRHGQTDWNIKGLYQGQLDIPLNQTGIQQAKQAALSISGKKFDAVYASDLSRTKQTAEIIVQGLNLFVHTDSRLREIYHGEWEGQLYQEIKASQLEKLISIRTNPFHDRPPGGESIGEVAERMIDCLDEINQNHPDQDIIIVSHGMAIATILCVVQGLHLNQATTLIPGNSIINTIQWCPEKRQSFLKINKR